VDGKMTTLSFLHCEKASFCFSFQKISLYRIDNPIVDTRTLSPKPIDLFQFPQPENSSGPGMRHFTILLAIKI
jgi:hypothetical protein